MSITPGTYEITSMVNGLHVGRPLAEDRSLLPKRIRVLPEGNNFGNSWVVEKDDDAYILYCKGAPVAPQEGKLFADLLGNMHDKKWIVTHQPQHGENVFTVVNASTEHGWVVPADAEEMQQVEVRPLIAVPSYPPRYPATELFTFTQVESD
ncbi:hypothetical protein CC1G_09480 [Coprinopsis cinerea okayama7|uniref:Serine protease inhibitor n=1 Tax=Coprinopsis cinerea (strain Okayama-7 / 130 / ATCC MYA-4618 / FGSC 9003) TaxID=240176 RepID=A8PDG8_COPC7|nr:hypothetical protein CC1G_09480 [Coprinopsis cinerea okayama7\|eukprot:XP_001840596.1 hypothetical protein CC1G_09480 [Coprinopsis cinerea okayama7\